LENNKNVANGTTRDVAKTLGGEFGTPGRFTHGGMATRESQHFKVFALFQVREAWGGLPDNL
jgi:hypothetical protein